MSYQRCRWYDFYPRLAFAFKLLSLAPGGMRKNAIRELQRLLDEQWGLPDEMAAFRSGSVPRTPAVSGKRWYDADPEAMRTVELLKNSPDQMKKRVADLLLAFLALKSA